jgi:RND family efflux transporter MFP subunit
MLLVALIAGCGTPTANEPNESKLDQQVTDTMEAEVLTVEMGAWPTVVRSQGSLFADEESVVGSKVAGRVAEVHVDLGDFVKTGDPLVSLDQEEFRLQVAQAEAQLEQTRSAVGLRDGDSVENLVAENAPPVREQRALWEEAQNVLERAAKLRNQDAIAEGEYDQTAAAERVAEARHSSAINGVREKIALIGVRQAELSLARQRLRDAVILAPLDGYIQQRQVAIGTYLSVGQPIAVVVRDHPLRFRGTVPERHAQALAVGQEVRLRIVSVSEPCTAKISRVSPTLDQRSRALLFEAEVDNSDHRLRTGLFAEAEVVVDSSAQAMVIPESAIVEFAGTQKVWKIVDGLAGDQEVLTGARRNGEREILQGLSIGDSILRSAAKGRVAKIKPRTSPEHAQSVDALQSDDTSQSDETSAVARGSQS